MVFKTCWDTVGDREGLDASLVFRTVSDLSFLPFPLPSPQSPSSRTGIPQESQRERKEMPAEEATKKQLTIIPRNRVVHELIADEARSAELAIVLYDEIEWNNCFIIFTTNGFWAKIYYFQTQKGKQYRRYELTWLYCLFEFSELHFCSQSEA